MKKLMSCVLIAVLCLTVVTSAANEDNRAQVSLELSQADEQGFFTASLIIKNASFNIAQLNLSYNKDVAVPVSYEEKSETDDFYQMAQIGSYASQEGSTRRINWISQYFSFVYPQDGVLKCIFAMDPTSYPNNIVTIVSDKMNAVVGEDGVCIYNFHFKRIAEGDMDFQLISDAQHPYFEQQSPRGISLLVNDGQFVPVDFNVILPDTASESQPPVVNIDDSGRPSPTPPSGTGGSVVIIRPLITPSPVQLPVPVDPNAAPTVDQLRKKRVENTIALNIGNYATVVNGGLRWIDSENKLVVPFIKNSRTYVPIRFISETMGAVVLWEEAESKVTIKLEGKEIIMNVGSTQYMKNGEIAQMDVSPEIVQDRTFVPIRFVAEALENDAYWNEGMSLVIIAPKERPWDETEKIEKSIMSDIMLLMMPGVRDMQSK